MNSGTMRRVLVGDRVLHSLIPRVPHFAVIVVLVSALLALAPSRSVQAADEITIEPATATTSEAGTQAVVLREDGRPILTLYIAPNRAWFDNIGEEVTCEGADGLIRVGDESFATAELWENQEAFFAAFASLSPSQVDLLRRFNTAMATSTNFTACEGAGRNGASWACNEATVSAALAAGAAMAACAEGGPYACTAASLAAFRALQQEWTICAQG